MGMFEMTDEQVVEWRQKMPRSGRPACERRRGAVSAAAFRRGGAAASMVASKAQLGRLVYAGIKLINKKKAGGLPERVMLAVTPEKLYAFKLGFKGRDYKIDDEVAVWERAGAEGLHRTQVRDDRADDRVAGRGREGRPWSASASRTTRSARS